MALFDRTQVHQHPHEIYTRHSAAPPYKYLTARERRTTSPIRVPLPRLPLLRAALAGRDPLRTRQVAAHARRRRGARGRRRRHRHRRVPVVRARRRRRRRQQQGRHGVGAREGSRTRGRGRGYTATCVGSASQRDWMAVVAAPPDGRGTGALEGGRSRGGRRRRRRRCSSRHACCRRCCGGGVVATHRDGLGHRGCRAGWGGGGRGRRRRVGAAVAGDGELGRLGVDHVDVCAVDGIAVCM